MMEDLVTAINRLAAAIGVSNVATQTSDDDSPASVNPGLCRSCAGRGEINGIQCRPCVGRGRVQVA